NRPYFMTDSTRAQVWKAVYEPFGTVYSTTGTAAQTYRFPGQWFQIESGLAYNWHRHYDATLGRYVSADPFGVAAGANVYGYGWQAPLEGVDETGLLDVHRDGGVTFSAYPGKPAGGTEHGPPHIHLKDKLGNEVRVSTKNWSPLPGEPPMTREMQKACNRLSNYDKGFLYRVAMRIYGTGSPSVQQVLRIGNAMNNPRTGQNGDRFSPMQVRGGGRGIE
ncbi:MAG: RHS repeat-associated core domain-containing protein, partial [Nitrosomonas ureae]